MMLLEPQRTRYDLRWRMFGIPTRVHPLFWLVILGMGWEGEKTRLGFWLIWLGCVFVSILLHEFGHALTAKHYGATGQRVVLYGLGGLAISDGGLTRKQRILELFMGPGAGFVLWGVLYGISFLYPYENLLNIKAAGIYLWVAVQHLLFINLVWGLFNLLPVYPLDGGQITREMILARHPNEGILRSLRISMFTAILVAVLSLAMLLAERTDPNLMSWCPIRPSQITILFFLYLAFVSYQLSRPEYLHAAQAHSMQEQRQPWEQDADWWKR